MWSIEGLGTILNLFGGKNWKIIVGLGGSEEKVLRFPG